jgi:DsbC/DsbD-like thiol-disulfide interchange protein
MGVMHSRLKGQSITLRRLNVIFHPLGFAYPHAMTKYLAYLAALTVLTALPLHAATQEDVVRGELLSGWRTEAGTRMTALHLVLAPGWKTYWRSPGDAGVPPSFDWSGSQNLKSVHFHWPRPVVFHLNGMQTIGYHDNLVLPIEVTAKDPSQPVLLRARVDLGVCKDICIPAVFDLSTDLAQSGALDPMIVAALADMPTAAKAAGVDAIGCTLEPIADGLRITAMIDLPTQGPEETVVLESGTQGIWVSGAQSTRTGGRLTAVADMVPPDGAPFALDRSAVTLTVIADNRAVEIRGCPAP